MKARANGKSINFELNLLANPGDFVYSCQKMIIFILSILSKSSSREEIEILIKRGGKNLATLILINIQFMLKDLRRP